MQAFHIYPGKGYIPPMQALNLQISLKQPFGNSAKLLIMYSPVDDIEEEAAFDKVWSSLDRPSIKD